MVGHIVPIRTVFKFNWVVKKAHDTIESEIIHMEYPKVFEIEYYIFT